MVLGGDLDGDLVGDLVGDFGDRGVTADPAAPATARRTSSATDIFARGADSLDRLLLWLSRSFLAISNPFRFDPIRHSRPSSLRTIGPLVKFICCKS